MNFDFNGELRSTVRSSPNKAKKNTEGKVKGDRRESNWKKGPLRETRMIIWYSLPLPIKTVRSWGLEMRLR